MVSSVLFLMVFFSREEHYDVFEGRPKPVTEFSLLAYLLTSLAGLIVFLPYFIAWHRQHPNSWAIFVLCLGGLLCSYRRQRAA